MKTVFEVVTRVPTTEEVVARREVLDIARSWDRGELPLSQVTVLCSGYDRWIARRFTPPDSPDHDLLQRLFDALVLEQLLRGDVVYLNGAWLPRTYANERFDPSSGARIVRIPDDLRSLLEESQ